ncbi:C40 family peptidase [Corynebacterium cystitidis]|uniref:C40 family peptidase n=1 Tax=Corynebacterium cystitidis TaxID=35757 RepID=UPI00358DABD5
MAKHRAPRRSRFTFLVPSLTAAAVSTGLAFPVDAQDIDKLISQMDEVSTAAGAKNEEVKELENDIERAQSNLDRLKDEAESANAAAARAIGAKNGYQSDVNGIAVSKYRNVQKDPLITTLESGNPQTVIDRASYLGSISRNTERTLGELQDANQSAAQMANAANIALAEAEFYRNQLDSKHRKLNEERRELEEQVRNLEEQVNSLDGEVREEWLNKNGPIKNPQPGLALNPAASGVVGAAMSKVGAPYGWGAAGPSQFDCSGLMFWAYAQNGKSIPRTSQAQLAGGQSVPLSDLQPGDIIGYYPGVTHVGMYIGNGQVVHASDYGIPVQVVPYNSMPIQGAARY